jgi:hypothetical protein
VLIT